MRQCDAILRADIIITQNANRDILSDAAIAIKNGLIEDIGSNREIAEQWRAREFIDCSGMLVMPGLINAHAHAAMTFLRGLADDLPLMEWLTETVFPVESRLNEEIALLGSLLGHAEMLATGTTACVDMYIFEDAVLRAADMAGIRCMGGEAVFGFPSAACADWRHALEATRELAEKHKGSDRLKVAVNPHSVYTTDAEILKACRDLAEELDLPVHLHLAETKTETERCVAEHGMRPVAWLAANGLTHEKLIAAHLVDITPDEADLLGRAGASGAHNPASNMKLASGVAPVAELLKSGVNMGLGTDGPASNNQLNLLADARLAASLAKLASGDPAALPAQTVLDMVTLGGARIFGDDHMGRLTPGAKADCVALDLASPNLLPLHNPVSQLIYAASGHECRLTMTCGEVVYKDGQFTRFDYSALVKEAAKLKTFVNSKK